MVMIFTSVLASFVADTAMHSVFEMSPASDGVRYFILKAIVVLVVTILLFAIITFGAPLME